MSSLNKFFYFRKMSGLTQKEFGKKLGIVQGYLSDIESGRKVPSKTLDILFEFIVRAPKGKSQIQKVSKNFTEINGGRTEVNVGQEEGAMYREKYLKLLEKHIQLQEEINNLREELKKVFPFKEKRVG